MAELKIGDRIKINYHADRKYIGKKGKIIFIGRSLKSGTAPVDFRLLDVDEEPRYVVKLDNETILDELRHIQLLKFSWKLNKGVRTGKIFLQRVYSSP